MALIREYQNGEFLDKNGVPRNVIDPEGGIASGRVLAQNTNYLFKITNTGGVTAIAYGIVFEWHESNVILA